MLMSIQFALWSNKSENVKLVQWVVRSFYKSPESVMLIKIYLIVITDQLRTTTSRSDQSHEQKFPDVFRAVECWWGAGGPRPWALPCWGCQVTQVTKISKRLKTHPRVTQTHCASSNLSSSHATSPHTTRLHQHQVSLWIWATVTSIKWNLNKVVSDEEVFQYNILLPDYIYVNVCVFILYL